LPVSSTRRLPPAPPQPNKQKSRIGRLS
jgi:hypothetical protein